MVTERSKGCGTWLWFVLWVFEIKAVVWNRGTEVVQIERVS